jgi:hypothetical protein
MRNSARTARRRKRINAVAQRRLPLAMPAAPAAIPECGRQQADEAQLIRATAAPGHSVVETQVENARGTFHDCGRHWRSGTHLAIATASPAIRGLNSKKRHAGLTLFETETKS